MSRYESSSALSGWFNGFMGVLIFSGSLPATRMAVQYFNPFLLTYTRAAIAGLVALCMLRMLREKRPTGRQLGSLIIVSFGVVVGFPLFTALALQHVTASHSIVFLGLLPLSTAIFGVLRGGEQPRPAFWFFSLLGSLLVCGFALAQNGTVSLAGDLLMLAAIIVCGLGYAEGAKLTKQLGGWQVISWALVISLPFMLPATLLMMPSSLAGVSMTAWLALGYVSLFSMLIGFIFWYKGLALGGTAAVGQLQLIQPFFALALSAVLLHEEISPAMIATTLCVIACVLASRKFAR